MSRTQNILPDVQGYLDDEEGEELARLAAGKVVLEIGSYKGRSTIFMAQTAKRVYCIDTWEGDDFAGRGHFLPEFLANVAAHDVAEKIVAMRGCQTELLPLLDLSGFGLFFVDADHTYEAAAFALHRIRRGMRPEGVVCVHDHVESYPGVVRAVGEFRERTGFGLRLVKELAILSPCGPTG